MEVKGNIRQRRHERIKHIRERTGPLEHTDSRPDAAPPYVHPFATSPERPYPDKHPLYRELSYDPRLQDPEYVWKHRRELLGGGLPEASRDNGWMKPPGKKLIWVKLLLCAVLFALIWGMFQLDGPWAVRGQQYVRAALTEDFQFARVAAWYERTFRGAPSFIPAFGDKKGGVPAEKVTAPPDLSFTSPVQGKIAVAFAPRHPAVELQTPPDAEVKATGTGRVVFVGDKEGSGLTVIVQHADQYQSVYGMLAESFVARNDWIEGGEPVGIATKSTSSAGGRLYFAVSKNNQYVDPADVVKFE